MRERHNVYVIELDKDVLYEAKFKKANPDYVTGKPCVYVVLNTLKFAASISTLTSHLVLIKINCMC